MPERALPFAHRASAPPMDADRGRANLELDNHGYVLQALSYTVEETITVGDMTRLVEVSSAFYGPQLKSSVKSESLPRLFHKRQRKGLYPKCSVGWTVRASGSPQFSAVRA